MTYYKFHFGRLARAITAMLFCVFLLTFLVGAVENSDGANVIRVGWVEVDGVMKTDERGSRTGYCFDYLTELSRYGNFSYEYVDSSWDDALSMLKSGDIDLISYIQYTEERDKALDFTSLSCGQTYSMLSSLSERTDIISGDYSTYDGKKIGVITGSIQEIQASDFFKGNGLDCEIKRYDNITSIVSALKNKEIDMIFHTSFRKLSSGEVAVELLSPRRFYLAVNKGNFSLLSKLNSAMEILEVCDEGLQTRLYNKYFSENSVKSSVLTESDRETLSQVGGKIRIVVPPMEGYLKYSADGSESGIYSAISQEIAKKLGIEIEYVESGSQSELEGLCSDGSTTLIAGYCYTYDNLPDGYYLTTPYYSASYYRITPKGFEGTKKTVVAALPRYLSYVRDKDGLVRDDEKIIYYERLSDCLDAVTKGDADICYGESVTADYALGSYRYRSLKASLMKTHYSLCFAVTGENAKEISLLISKAIGDIGTVKLSDMITENRPVLKESVTLKLLLAEKPIIFIIGVLIILVFVTAAFFTVFTVTRVKEKQKIESLMEVLRTKANLEETRSSMEAAISSSNMMYFEYYPEGHYALQFNGREKFGIGVRTDNYPESWFELHVTHPDYVDLLRDIFKRIDRGDDYATCDVLNLVEGKYRWHRYTFTSIYNSLGKRIKVACTALDITLEKEAEANYKRQLEAVRGINTGTLLSVRLDLSQNKCGKITDGQNNFLKLCDSGSADDFFDSFAACLADDVGREEFGRQFSRKVLLDEFFGGRKEISHILSISNPILGTSWVNFAARLFENPSTGEISAVVFIIDADSQVREKLIVKYLTSSEYDFIGTVDIRSGLLTEQDLKSEAEGKNSYSDYRKNLNSFIESTVMEADREICKSSMELSNITKELDANGVYSVSFRESDGTNTKYKQQNYSYLDEDRHVLLILKFDVTDSYLKEKKRADELEKALSLAKEANNAKTEFLSRMSHDMRTPMNGIIGLVKLSEDTKNVEELQESIRKIGKSGEYLLSLINDTLDMNKIESNKITLNPEPVNSTAFFENIAEMIRLNTADKDIEFIFSNGFSAYGCNILIDSVRVKQIFINLLSNAIKFTPTGGRVEFDVKCSPSEKSVMHSEISVCDTGIGMSEDFIANKMFKPFSQEYNAITNQYAGSGLGLAIVHKLTELMGGRIEVKSKVGKGTQFTVFLDLPITDKSAEFPADAMTSSEKSEEILSGRHILLFEDHPLNREIAKKLLERKGCIVDTAENGKVGLDCFLNSDISHYDAILMDIRMPVMDGLEASKHIRESRRGDALTVPIIAMTANAFNEDKEQSKNAGMDAHLAKPVNPDELYSTLIYYIKIRKEQSKA